MKRSGNQNLKNWKKFERQPANQRRLYNVPKHWKEDSLGTWVSTQQGRNRDGSVEDIPSNWGSGERRVIRGKNRDSSKNRSSRKRKRQRSSNIEGISVSNIAIFEQRRVIG